MKIAMNRCEFIKTTNGYAAYAALGMAVAGMFKKVTAFKDDVVFHEVVPFNNCF